MIFIDTGAFLARYLTRDQHHQSAQQLFTRLASENLKLCTSNFVLDETITLLARRASYAFAAERAATFYASKNLQILRPDEKQEKLALKLFGKFADQQVSFTDCVSFTLMKTHSLRRAFAYDQHFRFAGFELMPAA